MPRHRKSIPSYLPHKQSGKARAVWTDQTGTRQFRMLPGGFDSPESRAAFGALLLELEAATHHVPAADPDGITLAVLLLAYLDHAERHYRTPDGKHTSEIYEVRVVIRALRELHADKPVAEFGPLCVKAARQRWVNEGRSRTECNRRVAMIKRIFKWAVSEELAPPAVYQALATLSGLQKGRTAAREKEPVVPVDDAVVDATLPFLGRHVRGLVEFQRLTGCRPGEACGGAAVRHRRRRAELALQAGPPQDCPPRQVPHDHDRPQGPGTSAGVLHPPPQRLPVQSAPGRRGAVSGAIREAEDSPLSVARGPQCGEAGDEPAAATEGEVRPGGPTGWRSTGRAIGRSRRRMTWLGRRARRGRGGGRG
jgi:hypothetical protein